MVLKRPNGNYLGVAWNVAYNEKQGNETPAEEVRGGQDAAVGQNARAAREWRRKLEIQLPAGEEEYCLITKTVDEETCNPLKVWHDIGEPAHLTEEQKKLLRESAKPCVKTERKQQHGGSLRVELMLEKNAVIYFELNAGKVNPDRGYRYEKVISQLAN